MVKYLLVFDFDNTIIDKNTDAEVIKAQSIWGQCISAKNYFTNSVGWAESMTYTLKDLHDSSITKEKIDKIILDIPLTFGMMGVFEILRKIKNNHHIILLSHSNTYFIKLLFQKFQCEDCFDSVFTYDCDWIEADGPLVVKPYDALPVNCSICPPDFCKGVFLETYREKLEWDNGKAFDSVVYVGDGGADYCAALTLKDSDFVLARKDYSMYKRILSDGKIGMKANEVFWEAGNEIVDFLVNLSLTDA